MLESMRDMTGHSGLHLLLTAVEALVAACLPSGNLPSSVMSTGEPPDRFVPLLQVFKLGP